jgi:23S rRNA (uracil1939-C5)-methyltransferase
MGAPFLSPTRPRGTKSRPRSSRTKRASRARLIRVLKPGPSRVAPPCPVAGVCGGCAWQHLGLGAQDGAKAGFLREALRRIGGVEDPPVTGVLAPPDDGYAYRNKAQVPVTLAPDGSLRLGYYREGTHDVVALPTEGCRLLTGSVNAALCFVRDHLAELGLRPYDQRKGEGSLRHVMIRASTRGEAMLVLVTRQPMDDASAAKAAAWLGQAGIVSVQNNLQSRTGNVVLGSETRVLAGPAEIDEDLDGLKFRLSATSFFQVNPSQTLALLGVLKGIRPWAEGEKVLELYCGIGTLSLPLGRLGVRLHGVESHAAAVEDARANAAANGLDRLSFEAQDAGRALQALPFQPQVLLLDPPRKGLDPAALSALKGLSIPEIVYVSCDPASLARDVKALAALGYRLMRCQGVDLFPQTAHVESVNHLVRQGA